MVDQWPQFDWSNKTIILTGGAGFLGQHVVTKLHERGVTGGQIIIPRSEEYVLRQWNAIQRLFADLLPGTRPEKLVIIHLVGNVGGIRLQSGQAR